MKLELHPSAVWQPVYEGDSSEGEGGTGEAPPKTPPESKEKPPLFTPDQQATVDKIVESRLARVKAENKKTLDQLKQLQNVQGMTEEERDALKGRVESLEKSVMTKEELAARDRKEANEKHQKELQTAMEQANTWQQRFQSSTIQREITDAAVAEESFNPSQIVTLLQGNTQLVEKTADGQKTGVFEPRVKFNGRDKDGNPIELDLTVREAVTEMKKMEDVYGNLFKSGLTGGIGSNNTPGDGALSTDALSSQEAYEKNRERIKNEVKVR